MSSRNGIILKARTRFHVSAMGPQGGAVYKSGIPRSEAFLRHDDFSGHIEIKGFLVDGVPHVRIRAWELVDRSASGVSDRLRERVFYEGPLSIICRESDTQEPSCSAADPAYEACPDCDNAGWAVFNDEKPDCLGDIQRCDICRSLPDDDAAWKAATRAGYVVDADGNVLKKPR